MKKIYIMPSLEVIQVHTQQMLAVSDVNDQLGNGTQLVPEMDDLDAYFDE